VELLWAPVAAAPGHGDGPGHARGVPSEVTPFVGPGLMRVGGCSHAVSDDNLVEGSRRSG